MATRKSKSKAIIILMAANIIVAIALIITIIAVPENTVIDDISSTESSALVESSSDTEGIDSSDGSNEHTSSSETVSGLASSSSQDNSSTTNAELDPNFGRLLLINGKNPLPEDYDQNVRQYLVEIDAKYRNNDNVRQIHSDVYPYITAMVAAAQADGVDLRVWSPFRDYATQNILFQNQVNRVGGDEDKAATVVARPGTSEHNTGLCADFNMAQDRFESTPMYTWMCENAEDYGFILRYPKDKEHITGVIYESWHWRFVGINNAKEINKLGVTLEEYIEMKNIDPTTDMYGDD